MRTPGGFAGFGGGAGSAQSATKLEVTPADFSVFEQRLAAIQTAFGEEDFDRLRVLATPEMASYFAEELAANAKNGLVNRVSDVKFLRGDLSEAWREQQGEYATIAMRFSLVDIMLDRVSGRIVSRGSAAGNRSLDLCAAPGGRPRRLEIIGDTTSLTSGESQAACWRRTTRMPECFGAVDPLPAGILRVRFAGGVTFV